MSNVIYDQYKIQEELNQLIAGFQRNSVAISLGYNPMTVGCQTLSFDMLLNSKLVQENLEVAKQQRIIQQILNSSNLNPNVMQYYPHSARGHSKRAKGGPCTSKFSSFISRVPVRHPSYEKDLMTNQISKSPVSNNKDFSTTTKTVIKTDKEVPERTPLYLRISSKGFPRSTMDNSRLKPRNRAPPSPTKAEVAFVMQIVEYSNKEVEDIIRNFPPTKS